jgi:hypothetical protein
MSELALGRVRVVLPGAAAFPVIDLSCEHIEEPDRLLSPPSAPDRDDGLLHRTLSPGRSRLNPRGERGLDHPPPRPRSVYMRTEWEASEETKREGTHG